MQPGDQRRQGCRGDARTPLGARVKGGKAGGKVPLRAPDPQGKRGTRVRGSASFVRHGQGAHVVDAGAGTLDDGQGGGFTNGCLSASLLPASSQALRKT